MSKERLTIYFVTSERAAEYILDQSQGDAALVAEGCLQVTFGGTRKVITWPLHRIKRTESVPA